MSGGSDANVDAVGVLGFTIEKKASFTSLAAFLLSLWGVLQATFYYMQGSKPELVQPDRVIVFKDACHSKKEEILNFVMPITIINRSQKEYSSVIRDVEIQFSLGKNYTYDTESYVEFGSATKDKFGLVGCDENRDLIYFIEEQESVSQEVIRGGDSYVRKILFVPDIPNCPEGGEKCYRTNYLSSAVGISQLKRLAALNEPLSLNIALKYDNGREQSKSCEIAMNVEVTRALEDHRHIDVFCLNKIE